jgi:hypothetical protein
MSSAFAVSATGPSISDSGKIAAAQRTDVEGQYEKCRRTKNKVSLISYSQHVGYAYNQDHQRTAVNASDAPFR